MTLAPSDVAFPAMAIAEGMIGTWPLALGLLVEFFCVRHITRLRGWRCLAGSVSMNLVSLLSGILLIPFCGVLWQCVSLFVINPCLGGIGTFSPVSWGASIILAAGANALTEQWALRCGYQQSIGWQGLALLGAANLVSVTMAFVSIVLWPPKL